MSADTSSAANHTTANYEGVSGSGGGDAGRADGAGRHRGGDPGAALSKIDDPDAFHLKTVKNNIFIWKAGWRVDNIEG